MDAQVEVDTRFLPALADAIGEWFPEVEGRSMAVSQVSVTKENVPTLPLIMCAFMRSTANPPARNRYEDIDITDEFIVEFWLEPLRIKRRNGTESPFWSYYPYDSIRDTLLTNLAFWQHPSCKHIAYRSLIINADPLAVTLSFTFFALFRWRPSTVPQGDKFTIGWGLCTPKACTIPENECPPCDPCQ